MIDVTARSLGFRDNRKRMARMIQKNGTLLAEHPEVIFTDGYFQVGREGQGRCAAFAAQSAAGWKGLLDEQLHPRS